MEEFVGEVWHKLVTRQAQTDYSDSLISLDDISALLGPFYRAMGGSTGKVIETAHPRPLNIQRKIIQRIAGTHRRFNISWQDERSLRLPATIAIYPQQDLNENLYFWLTALAAEFQKLSAQNNDGNWFTLNQLACQNLLKNKPGLAAHYKPLVQGIISQRPAIKELPPSQQLREIAIRNALLTPGSILELPSAQGDFLPVPLWLYPPSNQGGFIESTDELAEEENSATPEESSTTRKSAQRIDDSKETDGFLIFQLESLFSWTEQVELDRVQDENVDDAIAQAAEDLDIINLSRQRRSGSAKIKFDLDLPSPQHDDLPLGDGIRLPEWDYRKSRLLKDYCLLQPFLADDAPPQALPDHLLPAARNLKKRFSNLKPQRQWLYRQPFGEELDLDSWIDNATQPTKNQERQDFFKARTPHSRELSCLLLADLSMSTDSAISHDQRIIDVIRDSLLLFGEALESAGDEFAIYGFSSVKNKQVRYHLLKNFKEKYSDHTRGRICAIKPGFYTRMGAAIRQSIFVLNQQKSQQKLLLIISDGKPNDIDHYEGRYGIEDTRQAILEAKRQGLQPFCVTIDDTVGHGKSKHDYLPYLFGDQGYTIVEDVARLPMLLPKLYLNLTTISS